MNVRFTPSARVQFLAALAYIHQDDRRAALLFRQHAETILKRLMTFPDSGRIVPEFPDLPYREVIVQPYRFFYRVKSNTLWIVAVWHGAQIPDVPHQA